MKTADDLGALPVCNLSNKVKSAGRVYSIPFPKPSCKHPELRTHGLDGTSPEEYIFENPASRITRRGVEVLAEKVICTLE